LLATGSYVRLRAQEFQGIAVYESKTNTSTKTERWKGIIITPDMQNDWRKNKKKRGKRSQILINQHQYKRREEKLEASAQTSASMRMKWVLWQAAAGFTKT
jgi:hypothetical protein